MEIYLEKIIGKNKLDDFLVEKFGNQTKNKGNRFSGKFDKFMGVNSDSSSKVKVQRLIILFSA